MNLLGIQHGSTTLVGHSHGGHIVANIVNILGDGDPFMRCVGLDTSTTDNLIHNGNDYSPSGWTNIRSRCHQIEFYKSSWDMSLEEISQLYGHYNFALICKYNEAAGYAWVEDGVGEFREKGSFLEEFDRHSSSWCWFVQTMKTPNLYPNLGFNFDGDNSWREWGRWYGGDSCTQCVCGGYSQ